MKATPKQVLFILLLQATTIPCYSQAPDNPPVSDVKQIFPGTKHEKNTVFHFPGRYEEKSIKAADGTLLNALLFKSDAAKGVIFYLHGNTDGLKIWGQLAKTYTNCGSDIFMIDYRGYGKSGGSIQSEKQLYEDVQTAYDSVKILYPENKIIVMGYSIGTGPAAKLASVNHPQKLILEAPYYDLADAVHYLAPAVDTTQLPFLFTTYKYLPAVSCPIIIFHGDADKEFYYGSSEKLKALFKPGDELITLHGAGHQDMEKNEEFLAALKQLLR